MNDISVLVIEDDKSIQNFIRITLKSKGYNSVFADDGLTGISYFYANNPDIILLDLGLPDIDGMEVLSQIRKESDIPIIVVSARGMEQEKVAALDEGADDYLTKPFHAGELLARIRVALRHKSGMIKQEAAFELDGFYMDFEKRRLIVRGEEVHVTPIEYKMLKLLVLNAGKVLTHHFIQNEIWGYDTNDDYQSIRVFMANIRRKIEEDSANPRFIITEVGVGYRFTEN
ncbi:MAG: response regulator transcription factor [Hungatella sp.]|nr:response regulator transcription factor [Hungatella xylanolytica]MBE5976751.1 response regulator transcription factor [Paenibacillaceae bacterium]MBE5990383.1 response regulator transcription factor [Paenibacillaceae bacterium]MTK07898.1 response regulator transcription factor [Hungatella sp.]